MSSGVFITRKRLHDGLCQQLTGAAMYAKVLSEELASREDVSAECAEKLVELVNAAVEEVHSIMSEARDAE